MSASSDITPRSTSLATSASAERNKHAIAQVLRQWLPPTGLALEIAAGTGQHALCFAQSLSGWDWQPTEAEPQMLPVIGLRVADSGLANLREPLALDVTQQPWPNTGSPFGRDFDAIFCANMLHIAPWAASEALMKGASRHLRPGGRLITYGPYFDDGPTAPSNLAFDADLRARNPAWGIRQLDDLIKIAQQAGLALACRQAMPANNQMLAFQSPSATA